MTPEQAKVLNQIEQKVNDLCVNNTREHDEIKTRIKDVVNSQNERVDKCDTRFDERPKTNFIIKLMGGMCAVVFALSILFGTVSLLNRINIATISHELHQHISFKALENDVEVVEDKGE